MHIGLTKLKNTWEGFCNVMLDLWDDIKHYEITYPIYIMSHKERRIWKGVKKAAEEGYNEWYNSEYNDPYWLCVPWTTPMTKAENFVLRHIHEKIYGEDWCVADPLGYCQVSWIMYNNIRNRVI